MATESRVPFRKRCFDLCVTLFAACVWAPVLLICALTIWIVDGRPILYISSRRVFRTQRLRLLKFRTMRRGADAILNRDTVPIGDVRFLNTPVESPLYTPIGRLIEICHFTELPQLLHVLSGKMTLIGNRPLPENVTAALKELYPHAEERFLIPGGLTGPVQLVGRAALPDAVRLMLEIEYCKVCLTSYSLRLDFLILFYTVLFSLTLHEAFTVEEVQALMARATRTGYASRSRPRMLYHFKRLFYS